MVVDVTPAVPAAQVNFLRCLFDCVGAWSRVVGLYVAVD